MWTYKNEWGVLYIYIYRILYLLFIDLGNYYTNELEKVYIIRINISMICIFATLDLYDDTQPPRSMRYFYIFNILWWIKCFVLKYNENSYGTLPSFWYILKNDEQNQ